MAQGAVVDAVVDSRGCTGENPLLSPPLHMHALLSPPFCLLSPLLCPCVPAVLGCVGSSRDVGPSYPWYSLSPSYVIPPQVSEQALRLRSELQERALDGEVVFVI